jgi:hypothetical protein
MVANMPDDEEQSTFILDNAFLDPLAGYTLNSLGILDGLCYRSVIAGDILKSSPHVKSALCCVQLISGVPRGRPCS